MMLIVTGILVGAVLGVRFNVLVLVPVICGALVIVLLDGIARGGGFWWVATTMIVIATALQLGYVLGSVVHFVMGAARVPEPRRISMQREGDRPKAA